MDGYWLERCRILRSRVSGFATSYMDAVRRPRLASLKVPLAELTNRKWVTFFFLGQMGAIRPFPRANAFERRSSTDKMLLLTDISLYTHQKS